MLQVIWMVATLLVAQSGERRGTQPTSAVQAPTAPTPPSTRAALDVVAGTDLTVGDRATALQLASRWLGVEIRSEQVAEAKSVCKTDGRWAFSSLVSESDPA